MKKCRTGDGRPVAPPAYAYCKPCLLRIGKGDVPIPRTSTMRVALVLIRALSALFGIRSKEFDAILDRYDAASDAERQREYRDGLDALRDADERNS